MPQPLDLNIMLTSPPQDSAPEIIASTTLRCDGLGLSHSGDLLRDPLTQQERDDLRWYLEEYWKWPYLEFAARGRRVEALFVDVGKRLYRAVFSDSETQGLVQQWQEQSDAQRQISIVSTLPRVLSLPWELLHDKQGFLALHPDYPISIVRRLPQPEQATLATSFEPPLRILLITARPEGAGFVDPRSIARELLDEVQEHVDVGTIELEFLRPATLSALHARLENTQRPIHILHFDGHGAFNEQKGQGLLAFENEKGRLAPVSGAELAQTLSNRGVRLVVLTACQSAHSPVDDPFGSVAAQLLQGGIDAVVAMSASFLVRSATRYVEAFYRAVATDTAVPIAQEQARHALYDNPRRHVSHRRLYEEGTPIELHDWWVPHFYQQRSVLLIPRKTSHTTKQQAPTSAVPRLNQEMPVEPRYGFSGRARELLKIERALLQGKLVVISGFGGVGKTALAREAADWLTRTRMYTSACFVSFEHGGNAATLLSILGTALDVYDSLYNPNDTASALSRLKAALKGHPLLVIADNLESILPGGDAPLEGAERAQLWKVLLALAKLRAGVLLTIRTPDFGDGRMAARDWVAHLPLAGLSPEDAYLLATRLLNSLGIARTRAPYADVLDLLAELDYHPLSIQLVLPALRTIPLATIRTDFAALLPKFVDDQETGRNRSLLASLDYSLQRLSDAQRALLPRLALFEGGASEDDLLAITEIAETEWMKLRPALEQAALLTAEQVGGFTAPFLHFHPVLVPYLRSQPDADDKAVRERYTHHYFGLAIYLYQEDKRRPHAVRVLVQKELLNLRRTLEFLLEMNELDAASEMADRIARFLTFFGLLRERDELRQRVKEAMKKCTEEHRVLTQAEFLRESGLGEDEQREGNIAAASTRLSDLLARIEELPKGSPLGVGSYAHCHTLGQLARCLADEGQREAAEERLREALTLIDILIRQQHENQDNIRERGVLLTQLADVLRDQGKYLEAREAYEDALKIAQQQDDMRGQAVALGQLGTLALNQRDYAEAESRYLLALEYFRDLNEPAMEAVAWHQLGKVAFEQDQWAESEHCYREGLAIEEQLGDSAGAAMICNDLANVALLSSRPLEAEGWYKRALELDEQVHPDSLLNASHLNNLVVLLVNEVRAGRAPMTRLAEAKIYAKQALAIKERLDASSGIWTILGNLADIADLEGLPEEARDYRRRERQAFVAFAGNRYHIDRQAGQIIDAIAAAAHGNAQAREEVEEALPELEKDDRELAAAIRRIWAGERDWHALTEDLDGRDSLLILRILETIA